MFAPFIVPVTASGLQGQQLLAQSSVFPTGTAVWGTHCQLGVAFPVIFFEPLLVEGLHVAAQEKLDESRSVALLKSLRS